MVISEEIIKVLDELGNRFGITIDWTADWTTQQIEEILPIVLGIGEKIALYNVIISGLWTLVGLVMILQFIPAFIAPLLNYRKTKVDSWCFEEGRFGTKLTVFGFVMLIFSVIFSIVAMPVFFINLSCFLKWLIMPEVQLIEYIGSLIE